MLVTSDQAAAFTDELTVDQALQLAIDLHRSGHLSEAERHYRAILQMEPKHPDANHNMGILISGTGKPESALPFFKTALEAAPKQGQFWISYIDAMIKAGQFDRARQVMAEGKRIGLRGNAVDNLSRMLARIPIDTAEPSTLENPGNTAKRRNHSLPNAIEIDALVQHFNEGRYELARDLALEMTEKFPEHPIGWKALGCALIQMGCVAESLLPMQTAIK